MTNPGPTHLFISCAPEDTALARWLARKLAAHGYPVWFEKMKSLGGEAWPQTTDETVKGRTFRMLALISEHSLRKKKPMLERMLAQRVVRQQNISDFLIPLKLDDSKPDELVSADSPISFTDGWANGWHALLAKLDSVKAPRSLKNGAQLAASSFPRGDDLINEAGGRLFANLISVKSFPHTLRVFQAPDNLASEEMKKLEDAWTFYEISRDAMVALIPPPPEFADRIRPTREQLVWAEPGWFHNIRVRDIAARLIMRALTRRLINAGCLKHPDPMLPETFYLPETFAEDGELEYTGFEGKKLYIPIRDKVSFRRVAGITEVNFHNFAFRIRVARGLNHAFYIQLTPTLAFFYESGLPIADKSAVSRLRRVTKIWGNEERLKRIMAAEQILSGTQPAGVNDPVLEPGLIALRVPIALDEAILESDESKEDMGEELLTHEFDLEEPEAEEDNE